MGNTTQEQRYWAISNVFVINFERFFDQIIHWIMRKSISITILNGSLI